MRPVPSLTELEEITQRGKEVRNSLRVTWLLLHTPVSANQVSWAMLGLAGASGLFAAVESASAGLAALLCLYGSYVLDRVDGEVARYRGKESWSGVYLDWLYHRLAPTLFHVGLLFRVYERHPSGWTLAMLALGGLLLALVKEHSQIAYNVYPRKQLPVAASKRDEPGGGLRPRGPLWKALDLYFVPHGAGLLYAPVLALDATGVVDALTWAVVAGFLTSAAFLARGALRLASGGLDRAVARVDRELH
jgi:hypothetical protein